MCHIRIQNCRELVILAATSAIVCSSVNMAAAVDFEQAVRPVLQKYCVDCHTGDDAEGEFDFSKIRTKEDIARTYETWESVVGHLKSQTMPPEDEPQPTKDDRARVIAWYEQFVTSAEPQPALFQARRLSAIEFRKTAVIEN